MKSGSEPALFCLLSDRFLIRVHPWLLFQNLLHNCVGRRHETSGHDHGEGQGRSCIGASRRNRCRQAGVPTDVGDRRATKCFALLQIKASKYVRVHPKKKGTFDCKSADTVSLELDLIK